MAFASDKVRQGVQQAAAGGYSIDNSLRFNDDDSAYLSWTAGTATNRKKWTWSGWVKRGNLTLGGANHQTLFSAATANDQIRWRSTDDQLEFILGGGVYLETSAVQRDASAWYHILLVTDSTIASPSGTNQRLRLYINGSQVTDFGTETYPALNATFSFNNSEVHNLGRSAADSNRYLDGYLAEVHFIDGQALDPTSFGETGDYGEWKPIEVTGMTYGTNGFYLDFGNTAAYHTITANGGAQHSTAQSKIGSSSIELDSSGEYLQIPDSNGLDFGAGDFTAECWIRFNSISTTQLVMGHGSLGVAADVQGWALYIHDSGTVRIALHNGSSINHYLIHNTSEISSSTWYHYAIVRSSGTIKVYRDGVLKLTQSYSGNISSSVNAKIGSLHDSTSYVPNFYIDEIRWSNSARYTSSFTPSTTAFTTDANTLLLLHSDTTNGSTTFTDSSTTDAGLGTDASSNTNNWTVNNLAATDQMLDSPTNNFCTLNPLEKNTNETFSEGNLKEVSSSGYTEATSTYWMKTGKWYWEGYVVSAGSGLHYGLTKASSNGMSHSSMDAGRVIYYGHSTGGFATNGVGSAADFSPTSGSSFTTGDIISASFDADNGILKFYKNGTLQATSSSSSEYGAEPDGWKLYVGGTGHSWVMNFGQDSSFAGNDTTTAGPYTDGGGIGDFFYEPPTGFLALCTSNLPDPAVIPSEHFNTVLYSGTGNSQAVTGVGFQPDFTWLKVRDGPGHHQAHDVVRGATQGALYTNSTSAEDTPYGLTSFDSDGYTTHASNAGWQSGSGYSFVVWCWKAGGTGVSNTNGSITSTVSANVDAGFSIVSYTGTGSNATVGHGLSVTPEMVIVKNRNYVANWACLHSGIASDYETDYIPLNNATTSWDNNAYWNDTKPTNSLFSVGTDNDVNRSGDTHIAYAFHSVDGYSKVGSYTGNGSTDGTFVYTGFRPAYVLIKNTATATAWLIQDGKRNPYNVCDNHLRANSTDLEQSGATLDLVSNGFKIRESGSGTNGTSLIYLAFAETPFKHSNAR